MAAPPNKTFLEGQMFVQHSSELYNKDNRANSAYILLDTYNWEGTGTMPSVSWIDPVGGHWDFVPGGGEISINSTIYSSLTPPEKRQFFQYLPKFIQVCLDTYDDAYGL